MALGAPVHYNSDGSMMEQAHSNRTKQKSSKYRQTDHFKHSGSPLLLMQKNYQKRLLEEKEKKLAELCRKREEEALRHVAQNCSKHVKHYFEQPHGGTLRESSLSANSQRTKKLPPIDLSGNKSRSFHDDTSMNEADNSAQSVNTVGRGKRRKNRPAVGKNVVTVNGNYKPYDSSQHDIVPPQNKENEDMMLPDMTKLKSKILARKRQLQKLNKRHAKVVSGHTDMNGSVEYGATMNEQPLTDFQKWQTQQDLDRSKRLKAYALSNRQSPPPVMESEHSSETLHETFQQKPPLQNVESSKKMRDRLAPDRKKAVILQSNALHQHISTRDPVQNDVMQLPNSDTSYQDPLNDDPNNDSNRIRLDLTYSKQHGLSEQMRAFRNNNRVKESRQNDQLQTMAGFNKPVLVRHDSHSTTSSRTSTRTAFSPHMNMPDRNTQAEYDDNWKAQTQTRETEYGNDEIRVGAPHVQFPANEFQEIVLAPCGICGRKFKSDRLAKHKSVCSKTAGKKRKVFNMKTARRKGTDLEQFHIVKGPSRELPVQATKNNWKLRHEDFINTIHHAKEVSEYVAKGGNIADLPPPPPSLNPDYMQCPYCERRFAPKAAERHIPRCKETKSRPPPPKKKLPTRKR